MALIGRFIVIILAMLITTGLKQYRLKMGPLPVPVLDSNVYWGPGAPKAVDTSIRPFKINYDAQVIDEIRDQLSDKAINKLRDPLEGTTFDYGTNTKYLKTVLKYWRDDYLTKWSDKHELYLNKFPQFKTNIQGLDIHFIHIKAKQSEGKKHYPLLLMHGWPGSVVEFYEFIEKIQKEKLAAFDLIVPSLPGYGFSDAAAKTGMGSVQISVIMKNLMTRLGYSKFLIQAGDWGSVIGNQLSTLFPENVLGYHSNMCATFAPMATLKGILAGVYPKGFIPEEHTDFVFPYVDKVKQALKESGYFHLQATKPDTIGAALTNNPIGIASYILEKFAFWTDHTFLEKQDGGLTKYYTLDQLLHNLMYYVLSNSIQTSQRLYAETFSAEGMKHELDRVPTSVPAGCARFRYDIAHQIDWALQDKFTNLIHSTYHRTGGHFAAFQLPDVLVKDFMSFVRKLE